ncbi:polyphosphate polymerase domain-containing protein [Nonomuraea sp. K274]|uniref:Polyphosphate polymerase domain-containing protein n=1 Tax=Nonomuraea cypriaca TaxID=1187855 RepID=A0A931AJZ4_9ACTN|nr:polyphosphate polymerase domain-containing protein [Nonomuraea cypriaca]MBF8191898.1 polyphosphate polymerase domain-containing protein [Nonomuraea cypriaca]
MAELDADVLLAGVAAVAPAVGLEDVPELMSRVDRKYLVSASTMAGLAAELGDRWAVLQIGKKRQFRYSSTYFDTPDLLTFRQHRQERRRRFKLRTRTYLDGGGRWLELKLNGARGNTDKRRIPYDGASSRWLTKEAIAFVGDTLLSELRLIMPETLGPVLSTDYKRVTLIDRSGAARLTCDTGLVCHDGRHSAPARRDLVLLESKSVDGKATVDKVLRGLGVRPVSVSKYCIAVAALRDLPANRWHPVLRRYLRPDTANDRRPTPEAQRETRPERLRVAC